MDFQSLSVVLQEGQDPTEVLASMGLSAKFLSDAFLDILWAAADGAGASIAGRRALWMTS